MNCANNRNLMKSHKEKFFKSEIKYIYSMVTAEKGITITTIIEINGIPNYEENNVHYHRALSKEQIKLIFLKKRPEEAKHRYRSWKKVIEPTLKSMLGDWRNAIDQLSNNPCYVLQWLLRILENEKYRLMKFNKSIDDRNLREIERSIKNVRSLLIENGCLPGWVHG